MTGDGAGTTESSHTIGNNANGRQILIPKSVEAKKTAIEKRGVSSGNQTKAPRSTSSPLAQTVVQAVGPKQGHVKSVTKSAHTSIRVIWGRTINMSVFSFYE